MRQLTNHHWFRQCWNIVNWTLRNKLQWNLNQNSNIFIQENTLESVVCETAAILSRPQCVNWPDQGYYSLGDSTDVVKEEGSGILQVSFICIIHTLKYNTVPISLQRVLVHPDYLIENSPGHVLQSVCLLGPGNAINWPGPGLLTLGWMVWMCWAGVGPCMVI